MENNKKDDIPESLTLDITAEKVTLNSLVQTLTPAEPEDLVVEPDLPDVPPLPSVPEIEATTFKTPDMATTAIKAASETDILRDEVEKFKTTMQDSFLPYVINLADAVSDSLPRKDGDKPIEQRPTRVGYSFVFEDRLSEITTHPNWA